MPRFLATYFRSDRRLTAWGVAGRTLLQLLYSFGQPLVPAAMNADGTVPYSMQGPLDSAVPAHPNATQLLRNGAVRFRVVATASGLRTDEHRLTVRVSSVTVSDLAARAPTLRSLHTAVFVPPPAAVAAAPAPPSMFGAVTDSTAAVAGAAGHMVVCAPPHPPVHRLQACESPVSSESPSLRSSRDTLVEVDVCTRPAPGGCMRDVKDKYTLLCAPSFGLPACKRPD